MIDHIDMNTLLHPSTLLYRENKKKMKTFHDGVKQGYEKGRSYALQAVEQQIHMLEESLLEEIGQNGHGENAVWVLHTFAQDLQAYIDVIKR